MVIVSLLGCGYTAQTSLVQKTLWMNGSPVMVYTFTDLVRMLCREIDVSIRYSVISIIFISSWWIYGFNIPRMVDLIQLADNFVQNAQGRGKNYLQQIFVRPCFRSKKNPKYCVIMTKEIDESGSEGWLAWVFFSIPPTAAGDVEQTEGKCVHSWNLHCRCTKYTVFYGTWSKMIHFWR